MLKSATAFLTLAAGLLCAQTGDTWGPLRFLLGKWKAEGGAFSFVEEVAGRTIVRRNVNNTPGQKHEDLMVLYQENGPKAIYFDSEGHVIRYTISFPAKDTAVFDSEGPGPKYRLSYVLHGGKLDGKFDVGGKTYLEWTSTKE